MKLQSVPVKYNYLTNFAAG